MAEYYNEPVYRYRVLTQFPMQDWHKWGNGWSLYFSSKSKKEAERVAAKKAKGTYEDGTPLYNVKVVDAGKDEIRKREFIF